MTSQNYTDPAELLAVVDDHDRETGAERRDVIHRDNLLHRAIHLLVFNPVGLLLLQQRSALKDMYPLHWECVGGHLGPGEDYEFAALREAEEELGITLERVEKLVKLPASPATDYEFITVYRAVTDRVPVPNAAEVIATQWLPLEEWRAEIAAGRRLFSPTLLHTLEATGLVVGRV